MSGKVIFSGLPVTVGANWARAGPTTSVIRASMGVVVIIDRKNGQRDMFVSVVSWFRSIGL